MKTFLRKYKFDIILVLFLLIASIIGVICFSIFGTNENKIAKIYVQNELVEKIDLSKENNEPRLLTLNGKNGEVVVEVKKNEIRIIESTCPNKNCIHQGVATTLKPLICTYNEVVIELEGKKPVDMEIG